jgi:hypothetical protein
MKKLKAPNLDLSQHGSLWNHVNVLGVGEEWPRHRGQTLFPILQINCADVTLKDNPLHEFSFVTLSPSASKPATSERPKTSQGFGNFFERRWLMVPPL